MGNITVVCIEWTDYFFLALLPTKSTGKIKNFHRLYLFFTNLPGLKNTTSFLPNLQNPYTSWKDLKPLTLPHPLPHCCTCHHGDGLHLHPDLCPPALCCCRCHTSCCRCRRCSSSLCGHPTPASVWATVTSSRPQSHLQHLCGVQDTAKAVVRHMARLFVVC